MEFSIMDILEQVNKVIDNFEKRERRNHNRYMWDEAYLLEELSKRYVENIKQQKWGTANDLLSQISRLVVMIQSE
jgi:hypothetical protein